MSETATQPPSGLADHDAIAERLDLLARFHDREPDAEFIAGLKRLVVGTWFREVFTSERTGAALSKLDAALACLPDNPDRATLDGLAAEYADVYLTYAYRISPSGSVWLTEDSLERQAPMFDVRAWYKCYGIEVPDWRNRADDHLVHQLQFLAMLLRTGNRQAACDAAKFLDDSLLKWLPDFAKRMAERAKAPFFVAAAALTAGIIEDIRDMLAEATGVDRPKPEVDKKPRYRLYPKEPQPETAYHPGISESW